MKAGTMVAEIMPKEMNPLGKAQKPNFNCSYFVLDNSPISDYIGDERPGRRPNPAPLIDIVNLILAQPFDYEWAKTVAAYAARKAMNPTHELAGRYFIDPLALWMSYGFFEDKNGKYSLYVTNSFSGFANYIKNGVDFSETPDGASLLGGMRIVNWEVKASAWGLPLAGAEAGSLGMKFKLANPQLAFLSMLPPIGGMDPKTFVFLDKAFYFADAVRRFCKGMDWQAEGELDPLILDLDGDGIETLDRGAAGVYFDHNVDLFAEATGWLSGDDGFLVLDENKNGVIDNGTEMFGGNGVSGLAELATHDSNGDGKITVADAIWSELRVWRDLDEDAVTDAGELFTLDAVGISGINLQATANDNKALPISIAA
jgi:hypothetical protein